MAARLAPVKSQKYVVLAITVECQPKRPQLRCQPVHAWTVKTNTGSQLNGNDCTDPRSIATGTGKNLDHEGVRRDRQFDLGADLA